MTALHVRLENEKEKQIPIMRLNFLLSILAIFAASPLSADFLYSEVRIDVSNSKIQRISPNGSIMWQIDSVMPGSRMAFHVDNQGDLLTAEVLLIEGVWRRTLVKISSSGERLWDFIESDGSGFTFIDFDEFNNIYVSTEKVLYKISADGILQWEHQHSSWIMDVVVKNNHVYFIDQSSIHKLNYGGVLIATTGIPTDYGLYRFDVDSAENFYYTDYSARQIHKMDHNENLLWSTGGATNPSGGAYLIDFMKRGIDGHLLFTSGAYIFKIDSETGNTLWNVQPFDADSRVMDMCFDLDGNIYAASLNYSEGQAAMVKLTSSGNQLWKRTAGGNGVANVAALSRTGNAPDLWQPWSRLGTYDLWSLYSNQLHTSMSSSRVSNSALLVTASNGATPLTDKQQIADLAVAMQAKLVAQETGFWDQGFIEAGDIRTVTASNKDVTGISGGEFGMATPPASADAWLPKDDSDSGWPWTGYQGIVDSFTNTNMEIFVPNHPDYESKITTLWNTAADDWREADTRRDIYKKTILFSIFPEAGDYTSVSSELRARFRAAFDESWNSAVSSLGENEPMTLLEVSLFFEGLANEIASYDPDLAEGLQQSATIAAEFIGGPADVFGGILSDINEQRVAVETLAFRRLQEAQIRKRLSYISGAVFGNITNTESAVLSSGHWVNITDPLPGWRRDPAMLFGYFDAKDEVESVLAALESDEIERTFFGDAAAWSNTTGATIDEVSKKVLNAAIEEALTVAGIASSAVAKYFLYAIDVTLGIVNVANSELTSLSEALQIMFAAATFDAYIEEKTDSSSTNSLAGIINNQTRSNIRQLLGLLFYSSYSLEQNASLFYGTTQSPWSDKADALFVEVLADYQMTNPISADDAAALAQAAYLADSVPGTINPPGQFNLTVNSGTGGTASGGGFKNENSLAPIIASPSSGYRFGSWSGSGITDASVASTTVLMDADKTVTASFLEEFTISVAANPAAGGNVSGGGNGVTGGSVNISASVNPGYRFDGWTGGGIADVSALSTSASTSSTRTVTANFMKRWTLTLNNADPLGGSVSDDGLQDAGNVDIAATPFTGYRFGGWTGAGVADLGDPTTTVTLDRDRTVSASFLINSTDGYNSNTSVFGGETDINLIGPDKDFDGDQKSNFYEYAFVLDPTSPINGPDVTTATQKSGENMFGRLSFKARSDDTELIYRAWVSGDLSQWTPVTITYNNGSWTSLNPALVSVESTTDHTDGTWTLIIEDKTPLASGSPRFIKLSVESPYNQ
jgi:hypothetical protein